jgi:tripartite-type tricarboxylate transporter receptor subunit TctC
MISKLAAVVFVFLAANTWAAFPERPIRLVVPSSPGSGPDVVGRVFAARFGQVLGQQIVVDNRAGANSIIGTETVARATPDGYTLLITSGSHTINPHVYRKLPYDTLANVNLTHVPYKGGGAAINDVLANQIAVNFASSPAAVPFVKAGRLRALGFTGRKRSEHLPDVATLDEAGLRGYEVIGWYGIYGPAKLPKPVLVRLYEAARDSVHNPDTKKQYADMNIETIGSTPDEFARFLKEDLVRYAKIVKAAGIEPQ